MSVIPVDQISRSVLLDVFDEQDAGRRDQAITRLFTPDLLFVDHNGARHGQDEIKAAVGHSTPRYPASASPIVASRALWTQPLNWLGSSDRRLTWPGSWARTPSWCAKAA